MTILLWCLSQHQKSRFESFQVLENVAILTWKVISASIYGGENCCSRDFPHYWSSRERWSDCESWSDLLCDGFLFRFFCNHCCEYLFPPPLSWQGSPAAAAALWRWPTLRPQVLLTLAQPPAALAGAPASAQVIKHLHRNDFGNRDKFLKMKLIFKSLIFRRGAKTGSYWIMHLVIWN